MILRSRAFASYSTAAGASEEIVDVAIVGAGMVGAAVAALLRECSLDGTVLCIQGRECCSRIYMTSAPQATTV